MHKNLDTLLKKPHFSEHSNHTAEQSKNTETHGKFEVDASLFTEADTSLCTLTFGGLDQFKGGVSDRIGAPHPKVWVTDPKKGREVSIGERQVKSLAELQDVRLEKEAKLIKEELTAISLYTGPMFYKYNAVLRNFPKQANVGSATSARLLRLSWSW